VRRHLRHEVLQPIAIPRRGDDRASADRSSVPHLQPVDLLGDEVCVAREQPGVFSPVEIDGRLLVDGGIADNVPVDVVRAMGADIVIAVDVGARGDGEVQVGREVVVRTWYRYHQLFATLLQHQLARGRTAEEIAEIHRRASAWYEANGMPQSAFEHALAANDVEHAVAIVSTQSLVRMFGGDTGSVVRWFDRLPKARIDNDAELLLRQGMALMGDWQLPRAYECTVRASELVKLPGFAGRLGPVLGLRGALEKALGHLAEGDAKLREAAPLVESEIFWFSLVHERHAVPQQIMPAVLAQMFTA
jgi:hypothetical protein